MKPPNEFNISALSSRKRVLSLLLFALLIVSTIIISILILGGSTNGKRLVESTTSNHNHTLSNNDEEGSPETQYDKIALFKSNQEKPQSSAGQADILRIVGQFTDKRGLPLEDAQLVCHYGNPFPSAVSDSNGRVEAILKADSFNINNEEYKQQYQFFCSGSTTNWTKIIKFTLGYYQ